MAFTDGSVIFINGGVNAEDNNNLFWNATANSQRLLIGGGTSPGEIRMKEGSAGGSNYTAVKAAATLAGNVAFVLPTVNTTGPTAPATVSGKYLTANASGVQSYAQPVIGDIAELSGWSASGNFLLMDDGTSLIQINGPTGEFYTRTALAGSVAFSSGVYGNLFPLFTLDSDGTLSYGDGSGTIDAKLEHPEADWLKTTDTGLHIDGGQRIKRTAINNANYTVLSTDYLVGMTSINTNRTWTLPAAPSVAKQTFVLKDESGSLGGGLKITLTTAGGTIHGAASVDLGLPRQCLVVYSNGTNYEVISTFP